MSINAVINWTPRILSLLFVGFIAIFAIDVFTVPFQPAMLLGLFIHLLPSLALLILVIAAWRYPLVGAIAFIGFALAYVWLAGFDRPWSWYAGISGPSLLVGLLYFASWYQKKLLITS